MTAAFNRSAIFRSAHRHAREMRTWGSYKGTYRQAFKIALREVWYAEKFCAEEAAYEATLPPIPADVAERARQLRAEAWGQRITSVGNEAYSALMDQARDLEHAARGFL